MTKSTSSLKKSIFKHPIVPMKPHIPDSHVAIKKLIQIWGFLDLLMHLYYCVKELHVHASKTETSSFTRTNMPTMQNMSLNITYDTRENKITYHLISFSQGCLTGALSQQMGYHSYLNLAESGNISIPEETEKDNIFPIFPCKTYLHKTLALPQMLKRL